MNEIACPVCTRSLSVRLAHGRKSGKPFVMLVCGKDGRHFRGFISDKNFVRSVMEKAGMHPDRPDAISTGSTGKEGRGIGVRPQQRVSTEEETRAHRAEPAEAAG